MSCSVSASKVSPSPAARQTSSASESAARPSPSDMRTSEARASCVSGRGLPSTASARSDGDGLEDHHPGSRQERGVELEGRVLGRRADERDGAVLGDRQEGVELGAVEAVDLVDEEQRALAGGAPAARRLEHLPEVGDAREDSRDLLEMEVGLIGEEPRHRGLAGPRRPPEHERPERARAQQPGQRPVRPDEMVLADDVRELRRAQPVGERPRRRLVEAGGGEKVAQPRCTVVSTWPPRLMVISQSEPPALAARSTSFEVFTGSRLMARITSPFWKPTRMALEFGSISVTATPSEEMSSWSSSATAGDMLTTVAPANGERALTRTGSRGRVSGGLVSRIATVLRSPARSTVRFVCPATPLSENR